MYKNKLIFSLSILSVLTICSCSGNKPQPNPKPDPEKEDVLIETIKKRMPAEFEPISMVKMCYPNNMPLSVYKTIAEDNKVLLLVNPTNSGNSRINAARNALSNEGANMDNITFLNSFV